MAAHELYLLHLGQLGLPDAETGETHFAQVPGYLIRTAEGRTVLVDTGNPVAVIGQPTAAPWWDHPNDTRPQDDIVQRLAELGITPGDVDLLISTHFDFDHCGRTTSSPAPGSPRSCSGSISTRPTAIRGATLPCGTSRASPTGRSRVTSSWSRG